MVQMGSICYLERKYLLDKYYQDLSILPHPILWGVDIVEVTKYRHYQHYSNHHHRLGFLDKFDHSN